MEVVWGAMRGKFLEGIRSKGWSLRGGRWANWESNHRRCLEIDVMDASSKERKQGKNFKQHAYDLGIGPFPKFQWQIKV